MVVVVVVVVYSSCVRAAARLADLPLGLIFKPNTPITFPDLVAIKQGECKPGDLAPGGCRKLSNHVNQTAERPQFP